MVRRCLPKYFLICPQRNHRSYDHNVIRNDLVAMALRPFTDGL